MALKLKGSTSGFVALDSPAVAGNNTITLPDSNGSANQVWANDNTAGVTTYTQVTINRNGDIVTPGTLSIGGTITYEDVTNVDSVGIITARTDIHLGEKLVHIGDTDTLMQFGTNTVTFETTGAEDLRIASGIVAIGTETTVGQGAKLRIGVPFLTNTQDLSDGGILVVPTTGDTVATGQVMPGIIWSGQGAGAGIARAGIAAVSTNARSAMDMVFMTRSQADGTVLKVSDDERLRITSAGHMLVGLATDRNTQMVVYGDGTSDNKPAILFQNTTTGTANNATGIYIGGNHDDAHGYVWNYEAQALIFGTNNTEKLRITSAGKVGINEDVPQSVLHVASTSSYSDIGLSNSTSGHTGSDGANIFLNNNLELGLWNRESGPIRFATAGTERLRITSTGNMGLGVTPSGWASAQAGDFYAFQVGTGAALFGRGSGDLDRGGISVNYYHTGSAQKYIGNGNANRIYMEDGAIVCSYAAANASGADQALTWVQRYKVDADGQFLIGTNATANTKPGGFSSRLQVEGTTAATSSIAVVRNSNDNNSPYILFGKSRGTAVASNTIVADDDPLGQIEFTGSDGSDAFNTFASIRCYVDAGPANSDAPGRLSFYTTPDSSVTPAENLRITRNGSVYIGNYSNDGDDYANHTNLWLGGNANMYAETSAGGGKSFSLSQNAHIDAGGDWTYVNSSYASNLYQYAGDIGIRAAASGTAGNNITWTNSGKFGVQGDFMWGIDWSNTLWDTSSENGWYYRRAEGSMQLANNTGHGYSLLYMNKNTTGGSNDYRYIDFYWDTASKGSITGDGSNTAYNTSSDHRLKENIVDITDGITRLKQLKPRRFNWIADSTNTLQDGFIAHEVSSFIPEAVTGTKDRVVTQAEVDANTQPQNDTAGTPIYQQMDYAKVTPLLTAALQEAIAEIETLKTKVAALESA